MALAATLLPGEAFLERSSASSTPKESAGEGGLSPAHIRPGSSSGLDGVAFAEEGTRMTEEERKEWETQWAETKKNKWTYGQEDVARDKEDSDRRMEHYRSQVEAQRRVLGGIYAKLRVDPDSACSPFTQGGSSTARTSEVSPTYANAEAISPSHREIGLVALTQEELRRRSAREKGVRQRQDLLQEEKTKKDEVVLTRTETRDTRRAHYLQEAQEEHQRRFFIKNSRHKETQKAQRELERDHERFTEAYYAALEKPRRFKLKSRGTPDGTADGGLVGRRSSEPPKAINLDEELQAADGTQSMDVLENIVKSHEFYSGTLDRWEKFVATNETRMNAYWYKMLNGFAHSPKPPSSGTRTETSPDMRLLKRKVKVALARESFMRQICPGAAKEKRGAFLPVLDDRAAQEKIEKKDRAVEEARLRAVAICEERAAKVAKSNERRFQRVQSVAMSKTDSEASKDRTPQRHKSATEFELTRLPPGKEPIGQEDSERWAAAAQHAEQVRVHAEQIQERARMQAEAKIAKKEEELKSRQALQEKMFGEKKKVDVAEVSAEKRERRKSQDAEYRNKAQERIEIKQARSDAFQHKKSQSILEKEKALRKERRQSGHSEKDAMTPKSPGLLSGSGSPKLGASPRLGSTAEVPTPLSGSQQLRRLGPGLDQNPTASPMSTLHAAPPPLGDLPAAAGQGSPVKASSSLRKVTKDRGAHLGGRSPKNLAASAPQLGLGDFHFYDEEDNHMEFPDCEEEERSILAELERRSSGWLRELQSKKNKSMGNWRAAK